MYSIKYNRLLNDKQIRAIKRAIKALEQEPCIQEKQANADKIDAVYIDGFKAGYSQARFDLEQELCEDCVSRNAIIKTLNEMDRYIADELTLCNNNNKFPQNEVFIVDDVYEKIEQLLSITPKTKTDVFDKIRDEIKALPKTYSFINIDTYVKENDVNNIIDKYKAESEDKE